MQQKQKVKVITLLDPITKKQQPYILELDPLGKGFYGTVFKAVHKHNPNMIFAVKAIRLNNVEAKQQTLRQLQIIKNIPKSPNLVDTHKQHLESQNNLYIFQQYCQGGSLTDFKQRILSRPLMQQQVYDMFYQLSKGYIDLNNAGIVHQDIKPSNILIKGKRYKYCDFGVSELLSQAKYTNTRRGTVSYMPPEKLKQKFLPNAKSDLYSLGVTLYEVIFGFHPYIQKKTKDFKEYLRLLKDSRLRPTHQVLERIYNPSLMFNTFLEFLHGMLQLKVELRVGIEELKEFLVSQQPFKYRKIPDELESPRIKPVQTSSRFFSIINQSKIVFRQSPYNQDEQNRLINQQLDINQQQQQKKYQQIEELRQSKLKQDERFRENLMFNIKVQHKTIQAIIGHLINGFKIFQSVYNQIQKTNPTCRGKFFVDQIIFSEQTRQSMMISKVSKESMTLKFQKVTHVLNLILLKLNNEFIHKFRNYLIHESQEQTGRISIMYDNYENQLQISKQVEFLEGELHKFIAEQNFKNQQAKKTLLSQLRNWDVKKYCQFLNKQFQVLFKSLTQENSIRINFKNDILNALFLLHIGEVLQNTQQLSNILIQEDEDQVKRISNLGTSIIDHSLHEQYESLNKIIRNFNLYKTLRIEQLKTKFYSEIEQTQNDLVYDAQQNTDEWNNFSEILEELQQEQQQLDNHI